MGQSTSIHYFDWAMFQFANCECLPEPQRTASFRGGNDDSPPTHTEIRFSENPSRLVEKNRKMSI